ncbi:hypothetical protein AKJ43_02035 [candidate division MSBL1 archaeon SCGC-AAA261D19]|uniref:Uncharacterized protein n=1 Tax=candidate division MSBL1 archaeon SCGC-AAA261D19 TaxID=1698273 RepID=A0A133V761_9EURY|nr:hypothetical protein AKJ43_02035 [candidate division MSBL1 archaeon SCGC-AAA261D19]
MITNHASSYSLIVICLFSRQTYYNLKTDSNASFILDLFFLFLLRSLVEVNEFDDEICQINDFFNKKTAF